MEFAIRVFFGSIEFAVVIVLSLSIFRFQFYYYLHKIYGIALLMSLISFYFRGIPELSSFAIIPSLTSEIILIMIVYRIPFFYSLLVCLLGFIAGSLVELVVTLGGIKLTLFNEQQIQSSVLALGFIQVSTAILGIIIIYLLQRRKIGFLFKTKNLNSRTALKGYNFLIASLLILGIVFAQVELISFNNHSMSILVSITMALILLIGILLAYKHNKSIIRETYERPIKDELDRSLRFENRKKNSKQL